MIILCDDVNICNQNHVVQLLNLGRTGHGRNFDSKNSSLLQADATILQTPEVISPYTPVAKPCGSVGNTTGGSPATPEAAGAISITSLSVISILFIALFWQAC